MPNKTHNNGSGPQGPGDEPLRGNMLRRNEIMERTTISASQLYSLIDRRQFPPFVQVGDRACGLPEEVLDAWFESRLEDRSKMRTLLDPVRLPSWRLRRRSAQCPAGVRMMRLEAVLRRVGLRKSQLYRMIGQKRFPRPVPLCERTRAWVMHEVDAWLKDRAEFAFRVPRLSLGELCVSEIERREVSREDDGPPART